MDTGVEAPPPHHTPHTNALCLHSHVPLLQMSGWREGKLKVGEWVDARTRSGEWRHALIVEEDSDRVKVSFEGAGDEYDEWTAKVPTRYTVCSSPRVVLSAQPCCW